MCAIWFVIYVIVVIDQNTICHGLEVNCIQTLNKRIYNFKFTEEHMTQYTDISFKIPDNECYIDERIALEENDTLVILPPLPERIITTITFSRPSTLPAFPISIFQTFPNVNRIHLISTGIEIIEENDFINATAMKILHMELNNIRMISKTSFANAIYLEELTLPGNRIQSIETFSFKTLKHLIKLDLQQNLLTNLIANWLVGADKLKLLYLNDNQIETIADGALYSESLERIYLQDNRLKMLSMDFLTGTPAVYGIDLSGNQLESIQGIFNKCSNLTIIGLKRNNLETIDLMELAGLPSLMMLSLENNHLKFNESTAIQFKSTVSNSMAKHKKWKSSKTHLEYLNLDSNNLSSTQILHQLSIFKRLKFLDLDDNQFKQIDDMTIIRSIFPYFIQLNVNNNSLSCSWLENVVPVTRKYGIILNTVEIDDDNVDDSNELDKENYHKKHVYNIPCLDDKTDDESNTTIKPDATGQQQQQQQQQQSN